MISRSFLELPSPDSNPDIFSLSAEFSPRSSAFLDSNSRIRLPPKSIREFLIAAEKLNIASKKSLTPERKLTDTIPKPANKIIARIRPAAALYRKLLRWREFVFMFNQSFPEIVQIFEYDSASSNNGRKRIVRNNDGNFSFKIGRASCRERV